MAATLYPLPVPPRPWHTVGLDYLTHLPESNGFNSVLIVVDHLTRMAHFLPCTESITAEETATLFLQAVATYPRLYVRPMEKHELELVTSTCTMSYNVLLHDFTRHSNEAKTI
jgi:hypothetical protein